MEQINQNMGAGMMMPKWRLWTGRILSTVVILFMLFDVTIHLLSTQAVVDAFIRLSINPNLSPVIGGTALVCIVLYAIPRTAILGAVLMTGYLGGAVLVNLIIGSPLFSATLFPVYFGIILWLGLYLRGTEKLSDLIRLRN